jgi:hypothetical protein
MRDGRARALADPVRGASAAEDSGPVDSGPVDSARAVSGPVVRVVLRGSARRDVAVEADGGAAAMCVPPFWHCSPRNPGTVTRS